MPDAFLALLCCKVMYSTEHSFAISGNLIADSVVSFRASTFDLVNPLPGSSKDGDSVIPLICNIVGLSTSFLPLVVGAGTGRSAGVSGYLYALPTPPTPFLVLLAFLLLLLLFSLLLLLCRLLLFFLLFLVFVPPPALPPLLFASPLPSLYPIATVPPSVAPAVSLPSSFPLFAPPIFLLAPPVCPCLPSLPPGPRFPFGLSVASSSSFFSVSSLLSSDHPTSSSFFPLVPVLSAASSLWCFLCPFCHLFGLFGSYPLLVSPFVCLVFCSFRVSSCSFLGSSCVLCGLLS